MPDQNDGIPFENKIREFLASIGFEDVPRWGSDREVLHLGGQEIDAFARSGDLYIVVDARTASSSRGRASGVQSQLNTINGYRDQVILGIKSQYESAYGYRDCLFIFWTEEKQILLRHKTLAETLGIALRDSYDLECYLEAFSILKNKEMVRNSFLKDVSLQLKRNIFIEAPPITPKATMTQIGNKKFYTFLIQARHLLKFAYVFRVETNNILASYQRLLDTKKIEKIRSYLGDRGFFANNILVAADTELNFNTEDHGQAIMTGTLTLPDKPCYLEIIDGQHRLLAYSNMPNLMDHCLCVTVISDLNEIDRARLFVIVNREQTKVPPYLLWDLYTLIEPESKRGKISQFVQRMNKDEPLKDRIKLPRVRSQSAYLSFTNLCLALYSRTNLFGNYGEISSFYNVVKGFFEVVRSDRFLRADWNRCIENNGRTGFVCTNNALAVYMYLLSMILKKRQENGTRFPANSEIEAWKRFLKQKMNSHIVHYLRSNVDQENQDDPYGSLRQELTNEGARRNAAEEIFDAVEF